MLSDNRLHYQMPYLTKYEVEQMLKARRHEELIDEHLIAWVALRI